MYFEENDKDLTTDLIPIYDKIDYMVDLLAKSLLALIKEQQSIPYECEKCFKLIMPADYDNYCACVLCDKFLCIECPEPLPNNPITDEKIFRCREKCHHLHSYFIYNIDTRLFNDIATITIQKQRYNTDYYIIWKRFVEKIYKLPKDPYYLTLKKESISVFRSV